MLAGKRTPMPQLVTAGDPCLSWAGGDGRVANKMAYSCLMYDVGWLVFLKFNECLFPSQAHSGMSRHTVQLLASEIGLRVIG